MGGVGHSSLKDNVSLTNVEGNDHCVILTETRIITGCYFCRIKSCWETGYLHAHKSVSPLRLFSNYKGENVPLS